MLYHCDLNYYWNTVYKLWYRCTLISPSTWYQYSYLVKLEVLRLLFFEYHCWVLFSFLIRVTRHRIYKVHVATLVPCPNTLQKLSLANISKPWSLNPSCFAWYWLVLITALLALLITVVSIKVFSVVVFTTTILLVVIVIVVVAQVAAFKTAAFRFEVLNRYR